MRERLPCSLPRDIPFKRDPEIQTTQNTIKESHNNFLCAIKTSLCGPGLSLASLGVLLARLETGGGDAYLV
jgi:hypothetical protein